MSITWENTAETQEFSADPIINRKIKTAAAGLQKSIQNYFLEFPTERDKEVVADFMLACSQQENVAIKTKRVYLIALTYLSRFLENKKSFDTITAKEFSAFLNRMYKDQTQDPNQSWISTQRTLGLALLKFFKWLAYPDLTPQERKRLPREHWPQVLKGFMLQRKKGALLQTPVTQKDIWDDKDVTVFLKYCSGDNPRLAFYHALAYETSARPGELLQLKIGDIADNIQTDEGERLCAFVDVGRYGKKKQSRIVGITEFTIQYFQKFLTASSKDHPDPTNKKAFLFLSREHSAISRNIPISNDTLRSDYVSFRDKKIPRLLKRPDVTEEDKKHLEFIRDTKKWYPYIMRHSSISKLAHEVEDYTLREHAGWSKDSKMVEIYTHTLTGDSAERVMEFYGINLRNSKKKRREQLKQEMVGPHCPFCKVVNVPDAHFCGSCKRPLSVISFDMIAKDLEKLKAERAAWEAERDRRTIEEIESRQKQFEDRLMSNYDRLRDEVMRLNKADLMNIKDERQRQREIDNLAISGVEALNEIELQEEEEAAARRVIAEAGDDDPRADDIDYQMELEIEAYKKQQQTRTTRRKEEE